MISHPRQRDILSVLTEDGECSVDTLARRFDVSDMTIRRDLQTLADAGRVIRTHGGATPAEQVRFEFQFLDRAKQNAPAKDAIGRAAATLVKDGQSVLLDSGTTTLAIARYLRTRQRLTVITTSLPIAAVLQDAAGVETMLLGGYVRRDTPDLGGPLTESNLENLKTDIAFIGADGIDSSGRVSNSSMSTARMLTKMATCAKRVYVVADAAKIGKTALVTFGHAAKWDGLITDDAISRSSLKSLRRAKANLIVAKETPERHVHE